MPGDSYVVKDMQLLTVGLILVPSFFPMNMYNVEIQAINKFLFSIFWLVAKILQAACPFMIIATAYQFHVYLPLVNAHLSYM